MVKRGKAVREARHGQAREEASSCRGKAGGGSFTGLRTETVSATDSEQNRHSAIHPVLDEICKFFGTERLATGIEQDEHMAQLAVALTGRKIQHGGFIAQLHTLDFGIA